MSGQRVAAVLGGAGEIGRACAMALSAGGDRVHVVDRAEVADMQGLTAWTADVTDVDAIRGVVDSIVAAEGRLDVLVLSVGYSGPPVAADTTSAELWDRVLDTNVLGAVRAYQAAVPALRRSGAGRIVVISSIVADVPRLGRSAYGAAKAALSGLTRIWALEEARHGTTVNAVCPGPTDTEFFRQSIRDESDLADRLARVPTGRLVTPRDVAEAVRFLASPGAGAITGQSLHVNGGEYMT